MREEYTVEEQDIHALTFWHLPPTPTIYLTPKLDVDALNSNITLLKLLIYKNVRQTNPSFAEYG
jgi:hypothetical protein